LIKVFEEKKMFCEKVFDVNSKMFQFMQENEMIDQEEKEILKKFSKDPDDYLLEKKTDEKLLTAKVIQPVIIYFKTKIESKIHFCFFLKHYKDIKAKSLSYCKNAQIFWSLEFFLANYALNNNETLKKCKIIYKNIYRLYFLDENGMILSITIFTIIIILMICYPILIYMIPTILPIVFIKFGNLMYFKFTNNFLNAIQNLSMFKEGNSAFDQIFRKSIKFIRELELVNFGLNM
jgi:hypothetical protein